MELAMRTKSGTDAWTAVVPWARAWSRTTPVRRPRRVPEKIPCAPLPPAAVPDEPTADDWAAAESALAVAREHLANAGEPDAWPGVMAGHAVHLAVARLRLLAARLELTEGQLAGGRKPR